MNKKILLIPSYYPDYHLPNLIASLDKVHFNEIVIVDDGSGLGYNDIFEQLRIFGCHIVTHEENKGKGAALKTGIAYSIETFGKGNAYVTCDSDGQHSPDDIVKVALALDEYEDRLILGTRSFGGDNVPLKSYLGNSITSFVFRLSTGVSCKDTQTGLRGIPACLEELALNEDGDRYEYEMNFLNDAASLVPFHFVDIETIYLNDNKASHFRPLKDSLLVYHRFIRFVIASLTGSVVDLVAFALFCLLMGMNYAGFIMTATIAARILSGIVNFLMNRYFSFCSQGKMSGEMFRYFVLFVVQMILSGMIVSLLSSRSPYIIVTKAVVDSLLFIASYIIQKQWVFKKELSYD